MITANVIRNVCLLGHSGSGKTALAESLLYMTGAIDRIGKNADGNTVCDYDPEEIRRNISISTALVPIEYKGAKINLLDTPGALFAPLRTALPLVWKRLGSTARSGICPASSTSPR